MKIGMLCYPTHGGSGVVATELGKYLAEKGHEIHFISYQKPFRLQGYHPRIFFHEVGALDYPLFQHNPYVLALVNRIVSISREVGLEILHAHYAIPHSLCAYLARQIAENNSLKVVTTLHGTDITLVGSDPSFREITAFSINQSDAVTAVSHSLKEETVKFFPECGEPQVIYNFVDTHLYIPGEKNRCLVHYRKGKEKILLHISNFRPVKRVFDVIKIFHKVHEELPARLFLVGDGPDRYEASLLTEKLGIKDKVHFLGNHDEILEVLQGADVLLMPSEKESFGLAILEAMSCGVPVVASRIGGIPEVINHGETGLLYPVGDVEGMAKGCLEIFTQTEVCHRFSQQARKRAVEMFDSSVIIKQYEELYRSVL
ncbi:MAG: N-acetyl-alpha-D-glucosaminyl L-malate synthase BshA [Candidatus Contubernalis sp.]|nr:N-acetyl-alpha-D-glucosaminyl L-malate synthase BshA [Candidatus Contubernalis sp.]